MRPRILIVAALTSLVLVLAACNDEADQADDFDDTTDTTDPADDLEDGLDDDGLDDDGLDDDGLDDGLDEDLASADDEGLEPADGDDLAVDDEACEVFGPEDASELVGTEVVRAEQEQQAIPGLSSCSYVNEDGTTIASLLVVRGELVDEEAYLAALSEQFGIEATEIDGPGETTYDTSIEGTATQATTFVGSELQVDIGVIGADDVTTDELVATLDDVLAEL